MVAALACRLVVRCNKLDDGSVLSFAPRRCEMAAPRNARGGPSLSPLNVYKLKHATPVLKMDDSAMAFKADGFPSPNAAHIWGAYLFNSRFSAVPSTRSLSLTAFSN